MRIQQEIYNFLLINGNMSANFEVGNFENLFSKSNYLWLNKNDTNQVFPIA